jgi:phosphohistidine swiveling domain-containing protein
MTLEKKWPHLYKELLEIKDKLENHFRDVLEIDFTVENGRLYILGVRIAKRTSRANLKFAIDFFAEGKIDLNEALSRIHPFDIENILIPEISNLSGLLLISKGLPASPGVETGVVVFNEHSGYEFLKNNFPIIYIKNEVGPEDIGLIVKSNGVLTIRGGMISHAALICRGIGKPCVCGCKNLTIDGHSLRSESVDLKIGDFITIDGSNGNVYKGKTDIINPNWRNNEKLVIISKIIEFAIRSNNISKSNIGHCWAIRDFFLHNISIKSNNASKTSNSNLNKYISFLQPKKETINAYWNTIDAIANKDKENYKYILQGIRRTLLRILSNKVGIGNHHKHFRPLFDPMLAILKKDNKSFRQLIGEEYFHINRYASHLIDVYNIKIFLEIKVGSKYKLWFLDKTNIKGESIIDKGDNITGYKIFLNEALVSYEDLPYFYNSLRKREYYWRWFQYNRTNYKEIVLFLKKDKRDRLSNFRLNTYAHELELLNNDELTISGMSLVGSSEARGENG